MTYASVCYPRCIILSNKMHVHMYIRKVQLYMEIYIASWNWLLILLVLVSSIVPVNSQNKWYASCVCHWFVLIPHKFSMCFFDLSARCGKWPRKELILKQSSGPSTDLPDVPTLYKLHTYIWPSNVVLKVDLLCCYILTATSSCHATVNLLLLVGHLLRILLNTC